MLACIDDDQEDLYSGIENQSRLVKSFGRRRTVCEIINRAVDQMPAFETYVTMIDDAEYVSPGWDRWLTQVFREWPNRIGVVSPAHDGGDFLAYPIASREWIDTVGGFAAYGLHRFTWDTALELLGEATNIRYATKDEMFIKHHLDERAGAVQAFMEDSARFVVWCATERRKTVAKLRKSMS
jgi:hypothetical protein